LELQSSPNQNQKQQMIWRRLRPRKIGSLLLINLQFKITSSQIPCQALKSFLLSFHLNSEFCRISDILF